MRSAYRSIPSLTPQETARFQNKIDTRDPDECWEWKAGRTVDGYGWFKIGRQPFLAHRIAWVLANGAIPPGLAICHQCDNPPCCNPRHLHPESLTYNNRDRARKGRSNSLRAEKHWSHKHPEAVLRGENNGQAKITEIQVREIRNLSATGASDATLAKRYSVSRKAIWQIVRRRVWRHVI